MEIVRSSTKVLNGEIAAAYGASLINEAIAARGERPTTSSQLKRPLVSRAKNATMATRVFCVRNQTTTPPPISMHTEYPW